MEQMISSVNFIVSKLSNVNTVPSANYGQVSAGTGKFNNKNEPFACILNSILEHSISTYKTIFSDYNPVPKSFMNSLVTVATKPSAGTFKLTLPDLSANISHKRWLGHFSHEVARPLLTPGGWVNFHNRWLGHF